MPFEASFSPYSGENIWGHGSKENLSCEGPNGALCTLCCWFFRIAELNKDEREECELVSDEGCSVHNTDQQPEDCKQAHCSKTFSSHAIYALYGEAANRGMISTGERDRLRRLLPIA